MHSHPLTWGTVLASHRHLVRHASCSHDALGGGFASGGDSDDGDPDDPPLCPCQWHPAAQEEYEDAMYTCAQWAAVCGVSAQRPQWDGSEAPFCGVCWAASCACGFVFEGVDDAAGRDVLGRLVCHSPGCADRVRAPGPLVW